MSCKTACPYLVLYKDKEDPMITLFRIVWFRGVKALVCRLRGGCNMKHWNLGWVRGDVCECCRKSDTY